MTITLTMIFLFIRGIDWQRNGKQREKEGKSKSNSLKNENRTSLKSALNTHTRYQQMADNANQGEGDGYSSPIQVCIQDYCLSCK